MISRNIFVANVPINMDRRFVRKRRKKYQRIDFFSAVKQRRNQHRRDYSDANADKKVKIRPLKLSFEGFESLLANTKWHSGFYQ